MNLGELVTELREGILHDFSDQVAGYSDKLWPDKRLVLYINEAQRRLARRGLVIRDGSTPKCCNVTLVAGQNIYPLDSSVIAVMSVLNNGAVGGAPDQADLARAGHSAFQTYNTPDPYYFNPTYLDQLPPGKPLAFSTDEQVSANDYGAMSVVNLRVFPTPSAAFAGNVLKMRVIRLPLTRFVVGNLDGQPEVPEDHQLNMLDWSAYLALRVADNDMGDDTKAANYAKTFEQHCIDARKELMRKTFTPLQWQFGRNGFSYPRDDWG